MRRRGPRPASAERLCDVPAGRRRYRFSRQHLRRRRIQQSRDPLRQPARPIHRPDSNSDRDPHRLSRANSKRNRDFNVSGRDADANSNRDLGDRNADCDRVRDQLANSYANANRIFDSHFDRNLDCCSDADLDGYFNADADRIFDGCLDYDSDGNLNSYADRNFDGNAGSDGNANLHPDRIGNQFAEPIGHADQHRNCDRDRHCERDCNCFSLCDPVIDANHSAHASPVRHSDRNRHPDRYSHPNSNADSDANAVRLARRVSAQPEPRQRSIRRRLEQQTQTRSDHQ